MTRRPVTTGGTDGPRGGWAPYALAAGTVAAALALSGCGSGGGPERPSTRSTRPPVSSTLPPTSSTSSTTTTSPTTPTTPGQGETTGSITIQISGASAIVQFVSSSLTGSLQTADPAFGGAGTSFSFLVRGVSYSGSPVTTTASTGMIAQVTAAQSSGGVEIRVSLRSAATNYQFGLGHDLVGVTFSG